MKWLLCSLVLLAQSVALAKVQKYELVIEHATRNMSGQKSVDFALTVNGSIPSPTLYFTEGDTAHITVVNKTREQASIHWHGLLLPNAMDGVPYLTTPSFAPGTSFTFEFPIIQSGTYWYHSHTNVQEQRGVYGGIVIQPKKPRHRFDKEAVAVISDWIDEVPRQVLYNLKKDGDYYASKKGSTQSWWGAIKGGGAGNYFNNQWIRMGGMDLSDVGYDAFLINGQRSSHLLDAKPGDRVRLRIINAGASSYFYVNLGQQKFQVISADGIDVKPVEVSELLMGMAETYDIAFTMPKGKSLELRATAQDITGFASAIIGSGPQETATDKVKPNPYQMDHSMHGAHKMDHSKHHKMDHSKHRAMKAQPKRLQYPMLEAVENTRLPVKAPRYDIKVNLNGDMERYVWFLNNTLLTEDRSIFVNKGDVIRFTLENSTMMHHPIHLHGHFFRVLNGKGDLAPLKHTVDVGPLKTEVIEFYANEPGEWFLHCHNLYHMKSGMAKVISYRKFERPAALVAAEKKSNMVRDNDWYFYGSSDLYSNNGEVFLRYSSARYQLESFTELSEYNVDHLEADLFLRRWYSKYFSAFAGGEYFDEQTFAVVGLSYTLPLFFETSLMLNHDGQPRLDIEKSIQLTALTELEAEFRIREHETDWALLLKYNFNWHWALGLRVGDEGVGLGASAQF